MPSLAHEPVRIWSAAASSGDEAFSAGIVAFECFGEAARDRVRILGTDISEWQVQNAERGICSRIQVASVSDARWEPWFSSAGLDTCASIRRSSLFARSGA